MCVNNSLLMCDHYNRYTHSTSRVNCLMFSGTKMAAMLKQYRERIRSELDRVVDFWLKYSHDEQNG